MDNRYAPDPTDLMNYWIFPDGSFEHVGLMQHVDVCLFDMNEKLYSAETEEELNKIKAERDKATTCGGISEYYIYEKSWAKTMQWSETSPIQYIPNIEKESGWNKAQIRALVDIHNYHYISMPKYLMED